jgi:hypothetical protein
MAKDLLEIVRESPCEFQEALKLIPVWNGVFLFGTQSEFLAMTANVARSD